MRNLALNYFKFNTYLIFNDKTIMLFLNYGHIYIYSCIVNSTLHCRIFSKYQYCYAVISIKEILLLKKKHNVTTNYSQVSIYLFTLDNINYNG